MMKRKKDVFLVTGGAGFIGSHIAEALLRKGYCVRIFDNLATGHLSNLDSLKGDLEFLKGDLREEAQIRKAVRGVRYVFHLAAAGAVLRSVADPLFTHRNNVTGTLNLLLASRDARVQRVVFSSSSSVYGNSMKFPLREDEIPKPRSPYAVSKISGEYYAKIFHRLYGLEAVCLRYFNVFGPRQDPNSKYSAVIPLFIDCLIQGKAPTIFGDGCQSRDFTYVGNVVHGNLLAMKSARAAGEVFNIACQGEYSVLEVLGNLKKILGCARVEKRFKPPRAGDIRRSFANIGKAKRALGYKVQTSFGEGLRKTVEWHLRKNALRGAERDASVP